MASSGPDSNRTTMVSIRLAPEEQAALRAEASERGQTLSTFIRDRLLRPGVASSSTADVSLYPASSTAVASGLAIESQDGQLVPRTSHPYVSTLQFGS
jgi:hypothetical protein